MGIRTLLARRRPGGWLRAARQLPRREASHSLSEIVGRGALGLGIEGTSRFMFPFAGFEVLIGLAEFCMGRGDADLCAGHHEAVQECMSVARARSSMTPGRTPEGTCFGAGLWSFHVSISMGTRVRRRKLATGLRSTAGFG